MSADPEPVIEGEAVEETPGELTPSSPGVEMVEAGTSVPAEATLFHTNDPAEVLIRATGVADVLARVLRTQKDAEGKLKLISTISGREHVRVEGWTLCGSMLGVFAIPIWTRKIPDSEGGGWEARVEARTLSGAVVGAAEAQCMRSENQWSYEPVGRGGRKLEARDDYALRSMAQTRATSKALRLPLGFIVTLAGFDATPAEEMGQSESGQPQPQGRRQEGPPPFPVPKSWAEIEKAIRGCDNAEEAWALFSAFTRAAAYSMFGKTDSSELEQAERDTLYQKAAGAVVWLYENVEAEGPGFYFFDEAKQRTAFQHVLNTADALPIPDYVPPIDKEAQEAADAEAEALASEEAGNPYP
jgi:hypothetical protein